MLAYSTHREFPSGEVFLIICENLYNAFASRRLDIIANTTCRCQACANVSILDLKIMAHHGRFDEMQVGPVKDISGADGKLDKGAHEAQVEACIRAGVHGLAVGGLASECNKLTVAERRQHVEWTLEMAAGMRFTVSF